MLIFAFAFIAFANALESYRVPKSPGLIYIVPPASPELMTLPGHEKNPFSISCQVSKACACNLVFKWDSILNCGGSKPDANGHCHVWIGESLLKTYIDRGGITKGICHVTHPPVPKMDKDEIYPNFNVFDTIDIDKLDSSMSMDKSFIIPMSSVSEPTGYTIIVNPRAKLNVMCDKNCKCTCLNANWMRYYGLKCESRVRGGPGVFANFMFSLFDDPNHCEYKCVRIAKHLEPMDRKRRKSMVMPKLDVILETSSESDGELDHE